VTTARVACDEVIDSLVRFVDLSFLLAVVAVSIPLEQADVALISIVELVRRFFVFGFDAFSFNSFNLVLEVISSPYFPSVRIRLFVFEDEGGGTTFYRNKLVTIERTAVEGLN
jgi:hypothetical protein